MAAIENALIVGGGIGGLVAARALRQAGIAVDLVEKASDWSVYGVGIIQPNNVLRALRQVGLAEKCIELGGAFDGWRIHDSEGNVLLDAHGARDAAPDLPANNGIPRPLLHKVLVDGAQSLGADMRLSTTVTDIEDHGASVTTTFSDGTERDYDLVIGFDGMASDMRTRLFGDRYTPQFTGQGVWRYNLPRPAEVDTGGVFFGPDTKVGLVPMGPDIMYMFVVTAEPDNEWLEGPGLADDMRERIGAYGGIIAELRDRITDPDEVVYRPMMNVLVDEPWHRGRVMILGDAAHSTTPHLAQGAAMAIEDAVLLSELLAQDRPVPDLLDELYRRRMPRAKYVVETSTQLADWELEQWQGIENPKADPGGLLHTATSRLMEAY